MNFQISTKEIHKGDHFSFAVKYACAECLRNFEENHTWSEVRTLDVSAELPVSSLSADFNFNI